LLLLHSFSLPFPAAGRLEGSALLHVMKRNFCSTIRNRSWTKIAENNR
jgi:hypothetical protein